MIKKQLIVSLAAALTLAATAQAGFTTDSPAAEGYYLGVMGGLNLYQNTLNSGVFGLNYSSNSRLGGFAGLKLGYDMKTSIDTVRSAVELDSFYNGYSQTVDGKFPGLDINKIKASVDSGAWLFNGVIRFATGTFQPYFGAGIGLYHEQEIATGKVSAVVSGRNVQLNRQQSKVLTSFAWQFLAGADYYVAQNVSIFCEYKFLNFMNCGDGIGEHQQLLGTGVRVHF